MLILSKKSKGDKMTERTAANGTKLETIQNLVSQFDTYAGITQHQDVPTLNNALRRDVEEFSATLSSAMSKYLKGEADSVDTFKDALKMRNTLLASPEIKQQGEGALSTYLTNIVHLSDNNDPETSLRLTKDLHANALDPHYKGVIIESPQTTGPKENGSEWRLQF